MFRFAGNTFSSHSAVGLLSLLAVIQPGCSNTPATVKLNPRPFDIGVLLDMEPFGDFDPELHFRNDLAVIFYFSELSCSTCTTRELENVADWHGRFGDQVDFYMVVHGQDPLYLKRLRRLGRIRYPILLEGRLGESGFATTAIAVIDKTRGEILASYEPLPDPDTAKDIHWLEAVLVDAINTKPVAGREEAPASQAFWRIQ